MRLKERLSIIWRDIKCYLTSVSKQGNQMLAIIPYKRRLIQIEERVPFVVFILGFCSVAWRFKLFTVDSFANRSTAKLVALVFFLFSFVCVFVFPTKLRAFVKSERHLDLCFNVFFFQRQSGINVVYDSWSRAQRVSPDSLGWRRSLVSKSPVSARRWRRH